MFRRDLEFVLEEDLDQGRLFSCRPGRERCPRALPAALPNWAVVAQGGVCGVASATPLPETCSRAVKGTGLAEPNLINRRGAVGSMWQHKSGLNIQPDLASWLGLCNL